jgi:hypothetical protein
VKVEHAHFLVLQLIATGILTVCEKKTEVEEEGAKRKKLPCVLVKWVVIPAKQGTRGATPSFAHQDKKLWKFVI